ncbi:acetolactate decarboxylase [Aquiflexum sp. LQ15W]|uniref:acetolactate decarboxylase n=1 Tax=Cognataquiflexum nitidum TaxID=2922272 RepID=UPI001F1396B8|nr:acetolactate decarboxylase [Cognataquiflexum nitidum]MCH6198144.1 acetolactate decarboxylase [Cognataquiflexum nitidum]
METPKELNQEGILFQVSVIDALLQGLYDGVYPVGKMMEKGDFGIGTFHALDGEMIILNDTLFQVVSSGEVLRPSGDILTPFAVITNFRSDKQLSLVELSFDSLKGGFSHYFPTPNMFYAVKLQGEFRFVRTRSVPLQTKPYPDLAEVAAGQPEFDFENVTGDIVGFYSPNFVKGLNVSGLHLHFLTTDRTGGGHILNFEMKSGTMEIGLLSQYQLILPERSDFFRGDFTNDRSAELEKIEK